MNKRLLTLLACPACGQPLQLRADEGTLTHVIRGMLSCSCGKQFPIAHSIPRFVATELYAQSFGSQWRRFQKTQLDSFNGTKISYHRFRQLSGLDPESLRGKLVLDAGCGVGRFSEVLAAAGAEVVAVDLSRGVEVGYENLHHHANCHFVQADLFNLPFRPAVFDFIYSFGTIHYTPQPEAALQKICRFLKPGGTVNVWVYGTSGYSWIPRPYQVYGTLLQTLPVEKQMTILKVYARLALRVGRMPIIGSLLKLMFPIQDLTLKGPHQDGYETSEARSLPEELVFEWAYMSAFNMFGHRYGTQWTFPQVQKWFAEAGLVTVQPMNVRVAVKGTKPV